MNRGSFSGVTYGVSMTKKAGNKGRERPVSSKKKNALTQKLAPDSAIGFSPAFDETLNDIERTGKLPPQETLEKRFPGITASPVARKEFLLLTVFNLRLRGYRKQQIANALGIGFSTVGYYVKEMSKSFEKEAAQISFTGQMGRSLATYRELQAGIAKIANKESATDINKLRAFSLMATMENNILKTLKMGNFFANARLNPAHSRTGARTEVDNLQMLIQGMFTETPMEAAEAEEEITEDNYEMTDEDVSVLRL